MRVRLSRMHQETRQHESQLRFATGNDVDRDFLRNVIAARCSETYLPLIRLLRRQGALAESGVGTAAQSTDPDAVWYAKQEEAAAYCQEVEFAEFALVGAYHVAERGLKTILRFLHGEGNSVHRLHLADLVERFANHDIDLRGFPDFKTIDLLRVLANWWKHSSDLAHPWAVEEALGLQWTTDPPAHDGLLSPTILEALGERLEVAKKPNRADVIEDVIGAFCQAVDRFIDEVRRK